MFCLIVISSHRTMQTHAKQKKREKKKKSEIQHAQSNERERLMVQKNCTVFFVQIEHTKKEKNNRCTYKEIDR